MKRTWPAPWTSGLLLLALVLSSAGCGLSHFHLDSYDGFDDWFVGRHHWENPDALSLGVPDGTFAGYILNDIVLRTPLYLVHDVTRLAVIPVAAPYYGGKRLIGSGATREGK